jgi:long-chain acyl-CoA synthetase
MPGLSPSDAAVISFTSGTVSASKAVLLSHHNLVANALQLSAWFSNLGSKASILCGIPLANLFGLTFGVNLAVRSGACMILEPSRSPDTLLQSIQANDPTIFVTVPVVLQALANQPGIGARFSHAVRYCVTGTAPLPVEVREAFERLTHSQIIESYGLCETTQTTHINSLQAARTGSIGLPLPGTQSRIVDLVNGQILPFGQIGELVLRGPQVFKGYWQASGSLQLLSETDGWLQTGDVARMDDDGYFFLLGSRSEMWLGEDGGLIFPRDAEEVIYEIPGVNEVAVVPVQNMPVAFISQDAGSKLRAETIYEFCQRRLPAMQIPQKIFFVDALPRTNSGKILRGELHDQANRLVQ